MALVRIRNVGAAGVLKDLSEPELPDNCWTDALNVRFRRNCAEQFLGHGSVYGATPVTPLHVLPVNVGDARYWLYASAQKIYSVAAIDGAAAHVNLTRQQNGEDVNYSGAPNSWTSTLLSGIPIFNAGNEVDPPQRWDLTPGSRVQQLENWPAGTFCKALRTFKNFLVALNVTEGGVNKPFMVWWSSPADPGSVPATWDYADETQDAGRTDLAESGGRIIDGLQLGDYFMIYKEDSVWRMAYTGGQYVFSFQKVLGASGALNRNCIVEIDGGHVVLTGSDVIVHDGQSARSVLDDVAREALFQDIDAENIGRCFVFKNTYLNEVFICYPEVGSTTPNKALVWNYAKRTVTYRTLPNLNHANYGTVDDSLNDAWDGDGDRWDADVTLWNSLGFTPNTTRVLMASNDNELFLLDASATFNGEVPVSYLERRGLSFGAPERMKLVRGLRPRITGNVGDTVTIKVGVQTDPYAEPEYTTMTYTIGQDLKVDCFVVGRYIGVWFGAGTALLWRLDSYDLDVQDAGAY